MMITLETTYDPQNRQFKTIEPKDIQYETPIQVVSQFRYVFIVTEKTVYVISEEISAMRAVGRRFRPCIEPTPCDFRRHLNIRIRHVAVGLTASFFVNHDGRVFVAGVNTSNCIGSGADSDETEPYYSPHLLDPSLLNNERCVYVACAALSTMYVTESNTSRAHHLHAVGANGSGQCATGGPKPTNLKYPTRVVSPLMDNERVKKISTGEDFFVVLTESGRVFVSGYNRNNQLCVTPSAHGDFPECVRSLEEIRVANCLISDVASRYSSNIFLTDIGTLYISNLFFFEETDHLMEYKANIQNIRSVSAGPENLVVITKDNSVFQRRQCDTRLMELQTIRPVHNYEIRCSIGTLYTAFYMYGMFRPQLLFMSSF
jgi:alpha-tubulin suppressor-like RCC1 family protein